MAEFGYESLAAIQERAVGSHTWNSRQSQSRDVCGGLLRRPTLPTTHYLRPLNGESGDLFLQGIECLARNVQTLIHLQ